MNGLTNGGGAAGGVELSPQARVIEVFLGLSGLRRMFLSEEAALRAMGKARLVRMGEGGRPLPRGLGRLGSFRGAEIIEGHPVLRFAPPDARRDLALFYLHGGAYVFDPSPRHFAMLDRLAGLCGMEVIAPLYPKAPLHAAAESLEWVRRRWEEAAGGRRLALGGDSAGAGLALSLAMRLRDRGAPGPERLVLFSPWLDLSLGHPDLAAYEARDPILAIPGLRVMGAAWAGEARVDDPLLSPGRGELGGLPRALLVTGTRELFLPDCRAFRERAGAAGIELRYEEFEGMMHAFPILPLPEAERVLGMVREELGGL